MSCARSRVEGSQRGRSSCFASRGDEQNVERMIEDAAPRFTLSDGFYERARYLLGLEEMMATGITFRAEDVYAERRERC
jgi:hypothetical protein